MSCVPPLSTQIYTLKSQVSVSQKATMFRERGPSRGHYIKVRSLQWVLIQYGSGSCGNMWTHKHTECGHTNTQREEDTTIKREGEPLQAKEGGSGQLPPSQPLRSQGSRGFVLALLTCRTMRKYLWLKSGSLVLCYVSPSKLTQRFTACLR